jgi:hypothetical protein
VGVSLLFWDRIVSPYTPYRNYLYVDEANQAVLIPDTASLADLRETHTEVAFPNSVSLHVDSAIKDEKERLAKNFFTEFVEPRVEELSAQRLSNIRNAATSVALIPCAVVLVFGAALVWALSGFSSRNSTSGRAN